MIEILIVVLSLAGLANSLYFTFAYYGRVKKSRWIPEFLCAREGSNCVTVVQTPYARIFGVPNSLLGIVYYLLVMAVVARGLDKPFVLLASSPRMLISPASVLLPPALVTVVLGFFLIYTLRRILHIHCPLCYTAHAINLGLFVLVIAAA